MEIDINSLEKELSSMIKQLIEKEGDLHRTGESAPSPDRSNGEGVPTPLDVALKYPDVNSVFFKNTETKPSWWEESRLFFAFGLLVVFAAFVFCRLICCVCDKVFPSGNLLFFFGVITLLFVGLVVLAYFIIKASEKHRAEKNERENKMLAFRVKMLETGFDLDNRKIIAEKHRMEKALLLKEKEFMYELDEKQREADHKRKVQLKQFEILEDYMKHMAELAKTGQNNTGNIDLLQIFGLITKEDQPAQNDYGGKGSPVVGEGEHDDTENKTQNQQTTSAETEEEPTPEKVDPEPSKEKPDAEPSPTEGKPEDQSDN